MSLLDLSTEILTQILFHGGDGLLAPKALFSIILTCKRLYQIALPSLYRNIHAWFLLRRPTLMPQIESIIRTFTHHLDTWVQTLVLSWDRSNQDPPTEFLKLVPKFPSMQQLTLFPHGAAWDDVPLTNFLDHCHEFASLQHVKINNPLLTTMNIAKIYAIPNLSTLVVDDFRMPKDADFVRPPDDYKPTKLASIEFRRTDCLPIGSM
ncbi:hypothetical protein BKA61DRAFT_160213 [Leptodontidium sp. MPI-SDFR-AT-0119]|nr:hypothetical protein BKA61DRAFT_160213 [Leptodontidium sp. MPI-SDFR-AT-0119]